LDLDENSASPLIFDGIQSNEKPDKVRVTAFGDMSFAFGKLGLDRARLETFRKTRRYDIDTCTVYCTGVSFGGRIVGTGWQNRLIHAPPSIRGWDAPRRRGRADLLAARVGGVLDRKLDGLVGRSTTKLGERFDPSGGFSFESRFKMDQSLGFVANGDGSHRGMLFWMLLTVRRTDGREAAAAARSGGIRDHFFIL